MFKKWLKIWGQPDPLGTLGDLPRLASRMPTVAPPRGSKIPDDVEPQCYTCTHFDSSTTPAAFRDEGGGVCRRHPPQVDDRSGVGRWPGVQDDDRCGEYTPDMKVIAELRKL